MAAFAAVVGALHAHLASVCHRINTRKLQKAEQEGRSVRRALAYPSWSFVACELLRLLQQFPSGVSEAVMYTHIVERWTAQARYNAIFVMHKQHALPPFEVPGILKAAATPQAAPDSRAASPADRRVSSVAAVLAASKQSILPALEARVTAVEAKEDGRPHMLALQDQSVDTPLGMFVHTRWMPLCCGPCPVVSGAQKSCAHSFGLPLTSSMYEKDNEVAITFLVR